MARKLRLEYAGACYHVINRGNYRRDLFAGKGAADSFLRCLAEAALRFGWLLHAFVVMRNHFHLAVETPEPNLSEGMKWLQGTWAVRFNRFRGEVGRPFQGRYKAIHVEPGHALAQVAHYIHLNPIRAGIVSARDLLKYRWSSLPMFAKRVRVPWLVPATVLAESGRLANTQAGWRCYIDYLDLLAEKSPAKRKDGFGSLSRGWAIGSTGFKEELRKKLSVSVQGRERFEILGADREAYRQAREQLWEEKLCALAVAFSEDLTCLPPPKSAPPKVLLAAAMKTITSVSHGWLAQRLQLGKPSSVGALLLRFRRSGGGNTRSFRQILSQFTT